MHELETQAREHIQRVGPLQAGHELLAANDASIEGSELGNGRLIVTARSAVCTELVRAWAAEQHGAAGYERPFAVAALGGTGRAELAPLSDHDFAFLFDDAVEGNQFLMELQHQVLHSDEFKARYGFAFKPLPFSLDEVPQLSGKQLNSFLDLRAVYDPDGLADRFRERIRFTYYPFEHFLHVRTFWKEHWEKAAERFEQLDRFDIKNDGLRVFLAGVWTLAGKGFVHSHEAYGTLEDPRDLEAYEFLLRIRAFIHRRQLLGLRSPAQDPHAVDVLGFDDFTAFGELLGPSAGERERFEFANEVRARLLSARRRVARFTKGVIERELRTGRAVAPGSPLVYGAGGLAHTGSAQCHTQVEKSRAALGLLLASQRYGVPVDTAELQLTFRNTGDWLVRVPELSQLFYEQRGSLAASFTFLCQFEGAEDRLFPGYGKFEASLDERVMTERKRLRGALERDKLKSLEKFVQQGQALLLAARSADQFTDSSRKVCLEVEAARLDQDHLAAVKLALKTKRLPLTSDDVAVRDDETRPLHERSSSGMSGIPITEYYEPYRTECDFTPETVRVAQFLVMNRRAFKESTVAGLNDARVVEAFAALCPDEASLRSLFVFTCADRAAWESEQQFPTRWFNMKELYEKALRLFRPGQDPASALENAGYTPEQLAILKDFGVDFFGGVYRQYANQFGGRLVSLYEDPESVGPKASFLRDGASVIIGVAARDYRGLAASISGALWRHQVDLRQAHLFSAMHYGLALDFFHVAPGDKPLRLTVARAIEEAIRERRYISEADGEGLPVIPGRATLQEWRPGQYCLRFETHEDQPGLIYALTYKVFQHLRGNIFGLTAHAGRRQTFASVYCNLPADLPFEEAQAITKERF